MLVKISAIIPATDGPATLARCRKAIAETWKAPEEVVVACDPTGSGPAQARNLGAQQATGDVLVFVDSDVEVHPDAFSLIRAAFERDAELTAVFGSYDDDPERHGLVSDFRNLLHHHVHHEGAGEAQTFWAGLGAVRREAFLAIGGFDEERFRYSSIEDIDLGMRIVASGGRILLDPAIQGKHLKRWTLANMVRTDLVRRGIPWARLVLDARSPSTTLNLGWRHRASAAASLVLLGSALGRRPRIAAPALALICTLNRSFYLLLFRQRGWRQMIAGIPLHVLHYLAGSAALPPAVAAHLKERLNARVVRTRSIRHSDPS